MKRYLAGLLLCCLQVQAQWVSDPTVNTPVFVGPGGQGALQAVSDGVGGMIVVWNTGSATYAQRVDELGNGLWNAAGVQLFPAVTVLGVKDLVADGLGGAIITWYSSAAGPTDYNVFAQRIDGNGALLWNGGAPVPVCTATNAQTNPKVAADGIGGAIIVWEDLRNGSNLDVYIQRVDPQGLPQWQVDGIGQSITGRQGNPRIVSDGAQGGIIVWEDLRTSPTFLQTILASRIDAAGSPQWIFSACDPMYFPLLKGITGNGAGGVIVCWTERSQLGFDTVLVQNIGATGRLWSPTSRGVKVIDNGLAFNPSIVSDGSDGAIVAWEDVRNTATDIDIYAKHVTSSGTLDWSVDVTQAPGAQNTISMIPRDNGGAILAWTDARDIATSIGDIYAQSFDGAGAVRGPLNGIPVSTNTFNQALPIVVSDGSGGGNVVWIDLRNNASTSSDVYAQNLASAGLPFRLTNPITQPNTPIPFTAGNQPLLTANFGILGTVSSMTVDAFLNAVPPGLMKPLPRYFDLSLNGTGFTATLTFNYTDAEVLAAGLVNGDANLNLYKNEGAGWEVQGGTVDTAANTVTLANVTGFSLWAMRDPTDTIAVSIIDAEEKLSDFALHQNYPNPFNPSTRIRFSIPVGTGHTPSVLKVYDVLGREVAILVNEEMDPGSHEVMWDASGFASGIYFYRFQSGEFTQTRRLLLLR